MSKLSKTKTKHVLTCFGDGLYNQRPYLLIEFLQYSIFDYLAKFRGQSNALSIGQIGQQMLRSVIELHDNGFLHQDIKPDNFRITENHVVKILDLGLANEYLPMGLHKAQGQYGFQGTPNFASINALRGSTLSRRDDIECIGYTLMYLLD